MCVKRLAAASQRKAGDSKTGQGEKQRASSGRVGELNNEISLKLVNHDRQISRLDGVVFNFLPRGNTREMKQRSD